MPEWIPIKKQLPPKKQLSLFCGIHGGIFLGYFVGDMPRSNGVSFPTAAVHGCGGQKHHTVTAWLPVPEPYIDQDELAKYEEIRNAYLYHKRLPKRRLKNEGTSVQP